MSVYCPAEAETNQGDVRLNVPFISRQDLSSTVVHLPGLIVSHSCAIDKYDEIKQALSKNEKKRFPVTVAPLLNISTLDNTQKGDVRSGRHRRFFHLPSEGPNAEMVADLWLAQPVPLLRIRRCTRTGTLSPEYLAKLWTHMFVATTRKNPAEVFQGGQLEA